MVRVYHRDFPKCKRDPLESVNERDTGTIEEQGAYNESKTESNRRGRSQSLTKSLPLSVF